MADFDSIWAEAVRYRRVSRYLRALVQSVYRDLQERSPNLKTDLEALLTFLASEYGRTDANCCAADCFFTLVRHAWLDLPPPLREIFSDMSGTLHDAIYAPHVAANFSSLPEQLLQRIRQT